MFRPALRNQSTRPRGGCRSTLYVEWVLGENRDAHRSCTSSPSRDPATGAVLRAQCLSRRSSPTASRSSICPGERPARSVTGDRTEFLGRNGSLAPARPRCARQRCPTAPAPGSIPCGAIQVTVELAAGGERDARLPARRRPQTRGARATRRSATATRAAATARTRGRAAFWDDLLGTSLVRDTRSRARPAAEPLAALSGAGLPRLGPLGVLPVRRRVRLPRSAAGRAGAAVTPRRDWRARICCAPRRGSSSKATCSTGGTRPAARACAPASPTTGCGCPTPRCTTSRPPATRRARRAGAVPRRPPLKPDEHEAYERPAISAETASLYEHCVRADRREPGDRRARPAADRHRRLERRHEPGRRRGPRRERLARLVPGLACSQPFAGWPTQRGDSGSRRDAIARHAATLDGALEDAWDGDWYRRAYFDDGTPLGSQRTTSAGSTRSRSRGR